MIVFYDSECTLCTRFKQAIGLIDRENVVEFKSIHDESVYRDHPELTFEACEEEVHMISNGTIFKGGAVIEELVKVLPGVKKFAWLMDKDSSRSAMDLFYGQINDMRKMQKKKCFRCGSRRKHYGEGEL